MELGKVPSTLGEKWNEVKSDQKILAIIVKVKSLKCVALKEIPKAIIQWNQKKA